MMLRKPFPLILLLLLALVLAPRPVGAQQIPDTLSFELEFGLHRGSGVYFVAREFANLAKAVENQKVWAPRLAATRSAGVAKMFIFTNGVADQPPLLEAIPLGASLAGYSPLWEMIAARWVAPQGERRLVTGDDDLARLVTDKKVETASTGTVFNGPVVLVGGDASGNNAALAPTLKQPDQIVSFTAANRRGNVVLPVARAFWGSREIGFLRFERGPRGVPAFLTGVATVEKLSLDRVGPLAVAYSYNVVDREGKPAQPQPVFDSVPYLTLPTYSPIWRINTVQWRVTPRTLRSVAEIALALLRREVTVSLGDEQATFNGTVPILPP